MQRLELAFRRITQFTADASHELRAPIALIRTTAEAALLEPRDGESYRSALADILLEGEPTTKLIGNLLGLGARGCGHIAIDDGRARLARPASNACRQGTRLAESKNIHFQKKLPEAQASALGDLDALRRLFLILIDNAIKYTPAAGNVSVELAIHATDQEVIVKDSGIGVAAEDLDHIFEPRRARTIPSPQTG